VMVGITVLPARSMRVAPGGTSTSARRPTETKRLPSTTNDAFSMTLPSPVMRRAPSKTVTVGVWALTIALPASSSAAARNSRLVCIIEASLDYRCRLALWADFLRTERAAHAIGRKRQLAQPHSGECRDRVADRAGEDRQAVLAGAGRRVVGRHH